MNQTLTYLKELKKNTKKEILLVEHMLQDSQLTQICSKIKKTIFN